MQACPMRDMILQLLIWGEALSVLPTSAGGKGCASRRGAPANAPAGPGAGAVAGRLGRCWGWRLCWGSCTAYHLIDYLIESVHRHQEWTSSKQAA